MGTNGRLCLYVMPTRSMASCSLASWVALQTSGLLLSITLLCREALPVLHLLLAAHPAACCYPTTALRTPVLFRS